jgi:ADP-heptose:LPS heptosyltransferase
VPKQFAVIVPGAGHSYKEWPRERFDAVAMHLKERYGIASVFVGVTETLEELKATVSLAAMVIANDSGVIQIARAFDIPTLVIAGATEWHEHHVPDSRNRVVQGEGSIRTRSFVSDHEHVDDARARAQMLDISVEQVTAELDALLISSPPRTPPRY